MTGTSCLTVAPIQYRRIVYPSSGTQDLQHLTCDGIRGVVLGEIQPEADHKVLGEGIVLDEEENRQH